MKNGWRHFTFRPGIIYLSGGNVKGKPLFTFAEIDFQSTESKILALGLPVNPVSSLVCFHLFVVPAIRHLAGWTNPHHLRAQARLRQPIETDAVRPEYHRASVIWADNDGHAVTVASEKHFVPVGLGDNDQCIEDDFSACKELWPALDQLLRDEEDTIGSIPYIAAVLEYWVVIHDPLEASIDKEKWHNVNDQAIVGAQHPFRANVVVWELQTPASDQTCTHLEFNISGTGVAFVQCFI
ncbi:NADPH--cytochrome P450 reductase [Spatholobus suberectus]|nr:NADPH--cytochrome P450 reductase [Spatholobus suberectus]